MGKWTAEHAAQDLREAISAHGEANLIVATGASQFEVLSQLVKQPEIDWTRVNGFHLDEYVGLSSDHGASFCGYLKQRFVDHVDLVEINHLYDDAGGLVMDQLVYYKWSARHSRFQVIDWRPLRSPRQRPHYDFRRRQYIAIWRDGEITRMIVAKSVRETWTQADPELVEREYLAKEMRKGLSPAIAGRLPNQK